MGISDQKRFRRRVSGLCGALILALVLIVTNFGLSDYATSAPSQTRPQQDISVVMIVLDEAPLSPIRRTVGTINRKRFPGFAALADTSTWYRNMLGTDGEQSQALLGLDTSVVGVEGLEPPTLSL